MNAKRWRELELGNSELTEKEFQAGWHFCVDWDGMLINKFTSPERSGCGCPLYYWLERGEWIVLSSSLTLIAKNYKRLRI